MGKLESSGSEWGLGCPGVAGITTPVSAWNTTLLTDTSGQEFIYKITGRKSWRGPWKKRGELMHLLLGG
jgi:hypothetical protein